MPDCVRPEGCPWINDTSMCVNSCYSDYSQKLTFKWNAEDADREKRGKYLGCPVCKQQVRFTCYHDGQDHASVELDLSEKPDPKVLRSINILLEAAEDLVMKAANEASLSDDWLEEECDKIVRSLSHARSRHV